jgi:hypothetical protein
MITEHFILKLIRLHSIDYIEKLHFNKIIIVLRYHTMSMMNSADKCVTPIGLLDFFFRHSQTLIIDIIINININPLLYKNTFNGLRYVHALLTRIHMTFLYNNFRIDNARDVSSLRCHLWSTNWISNSVSN